MTGLQVRRYADSDEQDVLALMGASLGWRSCDPNRAFFRWKHQQNAYGASPGWVAVSDGTVVGFRTFMRWEFLDGDEVVPAVRAVDTATHPEFQGRGIFRMLTLQALDELHSEGVRFVFNTPNDQSRPGYLKMGWRPVGTLPVAVRPRNVASLARMLRARVPADLWSQPTSAGEPAAEVLADPALDALVQALPRGGLQTRRSAESLRWRYGLPDLHYRVLRAGRGVDDGLVVFRIRRRGPAVEAAVVDALLPAGARSGGLVRRLVAEAGADYAVALRSGLHGMAPLPRPGPLLVWRAVTSDAMPALTTWRLTLGDVELF